MDCFCFANVLDIAGPYVAAGFVGCILLRTSAARARERRALNERLEESARAQTMAVEKVELAMTTVRREAHNTK